MEKVILFGIFILITFIAFKSGTANGFKKGIEHEIVTNLYKDGELKGSDDLHKLEKENQKWWSDYAPVMIVILYIVFALVLGTI